jgi:ABC-2 type transport system permease protein
MASWSVVARREFVERVKTKWFAIVTVLGPLGMIGLIVLPAWLAVKQAEERVVVEVVDRSGRDVAAAIGAAAAQIGSDFELRAVAPDTADAAELAKIEAEEIQGYLTVPPDALAGGTLVYRGDNASSPGFQSRFRAAIQFGLIRVRAGDHGLSVEQALALTLPPKIDLLHTTGVGEARSGTESFLVGYVVAFILYMAILLYAINVMRSVVGEKTSRVVELVVSAIPPRALMAGKVIGVGSVGLLQLAIWVGTAGLLLRFRAEVLGVFGVADAGGFELPDLGLGTVAVVLTYFVAGYFFFAALYAAIGAMVNSDQEAQQAQTPVVLLLMVPIVCAQLVAGDPRGTAAQVLTMLPFSSPVLMPMRWILDAATPLELAISLAILAISIAGVVALAARIYRVGILMYGKRPGLRELARWLRY